MVLQRAAVGMLRRLRLPPHLLTPNPARTSSATSPNISKFLAASSSGFSKEHRKDIPSWIILFGSAGIIIGVNSKYALADDVCVGGSGTQYEAGEAYLSGLQRVEDGSIVTNEHTSKWRIFTDNGRDLFRKGRVDDAEKFFLSALQEAKLGFGERDAHVASACNNLAELYRIRKAFEKAEPLYLEAINILEDSFGPEDIRVGAAFHNLGQFYLGQRKLEEARSCYEIKGRVLGHGHPDYANTMYHLGTVLNLLGKEKDSVALIQDSIRILEEGGRGESVTCIRRMKYLVQILLKSDRLVEAENWQRKILHVMELSTGWDSLETLATAESLALTLQSVGNIREAQYLLERCLEARKKLLPDDSIEVSASMLHLARVAMLMSNQLKKTSSSEACGELEKAEKFLDNSIRMTRSLLEKLRENMSETRSKGDKHAALMILLQSLDSLGLLEITKSDLIDAKGGNATSEETHVLHQFIEIFKQPNIRQLMLNHPDAKAEYLSCLKHLKNLSNGMSIAEKQELKEEIKRLETEHLANRRRRK